MSRRNEDYDYEYGNCIGCGVQLCCVDDAPNGDHFCTCVRCRAEERHDFDLEPNVRFDRCGHRVSP